MSMEWFRWWHGGVADPKFTAIARRAKQPRSVVLATWLALLEHASTAKQRGSLDGLCLEDLGCLLDLDEPSMSAILEEMERKGLLKDGRIAKWDERQPKREDYSSARVQKFRAEQNQKKRSPHTPLKEDTDTEGNALKRSVTQRNADETQRNADETQRNAVKRSVTQCNATTSDAPVAPSAPADAGLKSVSKEPDELLNHAAEVLQSFGIKDNAYALVNKWRRCWDDAQIQIAIGELATCKDPVKSPVGFVQGYLGKVCRRKGKVVL